MATSYQAVGWNSFKRRFDLWSIALIVTFVVVFVGVGMATQPTISPEILLLRAFGVSAFLLLHVILSIGPLCRLDSRWLPLLYNRRHLGVMMFLLGVLHGVLAIVVYHIGSDINPILSVLLTDSGPRVAAFPFQALGMGALVILFVMAATSHDFWLANLTAPVWKTLHMGVYVAYILLIAHVAFGVLQSETSSVYVGVFGLGLFVIGGLHIASGWGQRRNDLLRDRDDPDGFVEVCPVEELVENEAYGTMVAGERVAVLLYEGNKISCVSGICQHQNGPLAEGRYKYGCLTCPWHGYQYKPGDGTSPEPYTERIPTFDVVIRDGIVLVKKTPNAPGTAVEPATID